MINLSRRQLLCLFCLNTLWPVAQAVPIGRLLGNKNAPHTRFLLSRYLAWYQKEFFPFQQHLHNDEMNLLRLAIKSLPNWNEFLSPTHAIDRFFVGQELNADKMTSGRISTYTDVGRPEVKRAVAQVLKRHGVERILQNCGGELYGVGWDCDQNIFKIYVRYLEPTAFKNMKLKELEASSPADNYYPLRIASWRFQSGKLKEQRLYRVQKNILPETKRKTFFGPYLAQVTDILSDQGPQSSHWRLNNFPGISIPAALERVAEKQAQSYRFALDSIRYTSPEQMIAYYP